MVEEITRELIQQIVKETIQTSNQYTNTTVDSTIMGAIIGAAAILIPTMIKSFYEQKQNRQIQRKTNNLEFMKQIEFYQTELTKIGDVFRASQQKYTDCVTYAKTRLMVLDRMSYLKIEKITDAKFIQYFEQYFSEGETLWSWLKFTNQEVSTYDSYCPHFKEIQPSIKNSGNVVLYSSFYYYVDRINNQTVTAQPYNAKTDPDNPITFIPTPKITNLL